MRKPIWMAALLLLLPALAAALGLRAHGIVTPSRPQQTGGPAGGGAGVVVDVFAARDHARGGMARRGPRLVLASERGIASSEAVAPLTAGAVLGVLSSSGEPNLPDAARTIVREKRARALALASGGAEWPFCPAQQPDELPEQPAVQHRFRPERLHGPV